MDEIDAVITWVDGSDERWASERDYWRARVCQTSYSCNLSSCLRYRDWGTLPYVFRGIECFAAWIRNVYFVTWGHLPSWLNTENPRLRIVKHADYIPKEYLPTFSSRAIEFNFHRIAGLSERFVYFNDDTFLIDAVSPRDFFVGSRPVLLPSESPVTVLRDDMFFADMVNAAIINEHFSKADIRRRDRRKWLSLKIPLRTRAENLVMGVYPTFKAFEDTHMMSPYLKSTFETLWEREPNMLDYVCSEKFRTLDGPNSWLAKCWQIATGEYEAGPHSESTSPSVAWASTRARGRCATISRGEGGRLSALGRCPARRSSSKIVHSRSRTHSRVYSLASRLLSCSAHGPGGVEKTDHACRTKESLLPRNH